jgi:hypothetical protein
MPRAAQAKPKGPIDRLKSEAGGVVSALADRALSAVRDKVGDMTGLLTGIAEGDHGPGITAAATGARSMAEGKGPVRSMFSAGFSGVKEKVSGMFGGKKGGKGSKKLKLINIVETIDVGVPVRVAYDQWNQFSEFPAFMKKVESAERTKDGNKVNWKAQVFWSHRAWESTVVDQRPDERIIWRSKGQKGYVDGAVTFHELTPNLTHIVLILEYHPQGFMERTGLIWRAQGRRARLEFKHFARHVMTKTILQPDDLEGWRGVIEDSEVVLSHEDALEKEEKEKEERERSEQDGHQDKAPEGKKSDTEKGQEEPTDEAAGDTGADEDAGADEDTEADEEPEDEGPQAAEVADEDTAADGHREARASRRRRPAPARTAREKVPRQRSGDEQPQRRAKGAARGRSK